MRPYRINPPTAKKVDAILDRFLAAGLIQHSTSPWASPVVVIPKKSGDIRITVNYKKLKKLSILGQLPIPRSTKFSINLVPVEYFHSSTSSLLFIR